MENKWFLISAVLAIIAISSIATIYSMDEKIEKENLEGNPEQLETATLAGGCFWCVEAQYEGLEGVKDAVSGYAGGEKETATYNQVSTGETNHREAVQVKYDPSKISYKEILDIFWKSIDPTDARGQFSDRGPQYTTAIYYHNDEQKQIAEQTKKELEESGKFEEPIVTKIEPFTTFFKAEEKHQNYSQKRTLAYKAYEKASGRKEFIEENWKNENKNQKSVEDLGPMQKYVTQKNGTEPPFANKYWNNNKTGIYVDILTGEPLFSSEHKYKSGTGWPSFYRPIDYDNIKTLEDNSLVQKRVEVRSREGDNHLGHVFDDGPEPTGKRYCMNSAALEFIQKEEMEERGYSLDLLEGK